MSTKKRYLLDGLWKTLYDMVTVHGRGVTAGEVARQRGVARSTAKRWLNDMVAEGGAVTETVAGRNHQDTQLYAPVLITADRAFLEKNR